MTDPRTAVYEIANYIQGIEQLTVTTLRNVIGSLDLEQTLTSRDQINRQLCGVLDEATGRWGIRVNRVEIKAIDPPPSVQDSMEKQMRAERDRRATILNAEGVKQSQILTAEGEQQAAILRAEGDRAGGILEAQGQAGRSSRCSTAIHSGDPDQKLLAYQYLQVLPQIAQGDANKVWIVPTRADPGAGRASGGALGGGRAEGLSNILRNGLGLREKGHLAETGADDGPAAVDFAEPALEDPRAALDRARAEAAEAVADAEGEARRTGIAPGPGSALAGALIAPKPGASTSKGPAPTRCRALWPPGRPRLEHPAYRSLAVAGRGPSGRTRSARRACGRGRRRAARSPRQSRRWLFADQLGPHFLDHPGQRALLVESRAVFRRRRLHRVKAHLLLSAPAAPRRASWRPRDPAPHRDLPRGARPADRRRAPHGLRPDLTPRAAVRPRAGRRRRCRRPAGPGFAVSESRFDTWAQRRGARRLLLEDFYRDVRRLHGLLLDERGEPEGGRWNFDESNRQPPPRRARAPGGDRPPEPWWPAEDDVDAQVRDDLDRWAKTASIRGGTGPVRCRHPRRGVEALEWFVEHRLDGFGPHEDAMLGWRRWMARRFRRR